MFSVSHRWLETIALTIAPKNHPVLLTGLIQKLKDGYLNDNSISYFYVRMFLEEKILLKY